MEARAHARDWCAVVVDHGETETDGEQQTCEMIEMKRTAAASGGESGLRPVPDDENGREHAEEVLAHGVEEAEVLREQAVDGLKDILQEIVLHGSGSFDVTGQDDRDYGMRKFCN